MLSIIARRTKLQTLFGKFVYSLPGLRTYAECGVVNDDTDCLKIQTSKCPQIRTPPGKKRFTLDQSGLEAIQQCCVRASFRETPCGQVRRQHTKGKKSDGDKQPKAKPFKSMWEDLPKPPLSYEDTIVRMDHMNYVPRDKNRLFQRTWIDCPVEMKTRKKCLIKKIQPPPMVKRPKPARVTSDTARKMCSKSKCPKIKMLHCRASRMNPKCIVDRAPSDCVRIHPPFPSFSECKKPFIRKARPVECACLDTPAICDVAAAQRKMDEQKGKKS